MAYGMWLENDADELVLSDAGITYGYVGRARLVAVVQPETNVVSATAGGSTYTIDWPGDILVALPVKANGSTKFRSATRAGNTWTIVVHKASGVVTALGFDVQEATEVYVFGAPSAATAGSWGCVLYDDNENVCADLSRRPLAYKARIVMLDPLADWSVPAGNYVPAVIGNPIGSSRTSVKSGAVHVIRSYSTGWIMGASGTLAILSYQDRREQDDGPAVAYNNRLSAVALLVDATTL